MLKIGTPAEIHAHLISALSKKIDNAHNNINRLHDTINGLGSEEPTDIAELAAIVKLIKDWNQNAEYHLNLSALRMLRHDSPQV